MTWKDKFSRKFRGFGLENLMIYILIPMALVFVMENLLSMPIIQHIAFSRSAILSGEVWRVITFLFVPTTSNFLFFILFVSVYLFFGKSVENAWGKELFNLFYIISVVAAIIAGFIMGRTDNTYINLSIFIAFGAIFPDVELLLMGIIPVKAKYLAILDLAFYAINLVISLLVRDFVTVVTLLLSLAALIIFFGRDFFDSMTKRKNVRRRRQDYKDSWR